jgi:hypothetical protein
MRSWNAAEAQGQSIISMYRDNMPGDCRFTCSVNLSNWRHRHHFFTAISQFPEANSAIAGSGNSLMILNQKSDRGQFLESSPTVLLRKASFASPLVRDAGGVGLGLFCKSKGRSQRDACGQRVSVNTTNGRAGDVKLRPQA